jgi:hypothetical protein
VPAVKTEGQLLLSAVYGVLSIAKGIRSETALTVGSHSSNRYRSNGCRPSIL